MTIVDTSVWIDYLRNIDDLHTIWLSGELTRGRIGVTDAILCEVLQGIQDDTIFSRLHRSFSEFEIFNTGGEDIAVASAKNYRFLRAKGRTVRKTIDCMIATFCITEGHTLLHNDRDFDPFEEFLGLSVVHPSAH
jgi:predicted nucleic acid-binding protein